MTCCVIADSEIQIMEIKVKTLGELALELIDLMSRDIDYSCAEINEKIFNLHSMGQTDLANQAYQILSSLQDLKHHILKESFSLGH